MKTIILVLALSPLVWNAQAAAAEGAKATVQPRNDLENWDDDVWADWGAQPTAPKADDVRDNPNAMADAGAPPTDTFGGAAANESANGFGESPDRIRFRLVREGSEGPRGVRKYRPQYVRRSL